MSRKTGASKQAHTSELKTFDWFVGLLYVIGAIAFAAIAALFIFLLSP